MNRARLMAQSPDFRAGYLAACNNEPWDRARSKDWLKGYFQAVNDT